MKKSAFLAALAGSLVISLHLIAQNPTPPPFPTRDGVVLTPIVDMSFGDFTLPLGASGGTVILNTNNSRDYSGYVYLLEMGTPVRAAMFEFKLCPGRTVKIYYSTPVKITSNNGKYMDVDYLDFAIDGGTVDKSNNGFITFTSNKGCNEIHRIYVGGKLAVKDLTSNPAGTYHSNLSLEIVQQ